MHHVLVDLSLLDRCFIRSGHIPGPSGHVHQPVQLCSGVSAEGIDASLG